MSLIGKIVGVAKINDLRMPCDGEIEILDIGQQHKTAYISWKIFDNSGELYSDSQPGQS
jgi:hypothetical protein